MRRLLIKTKVIPSAKKKKSRTRAACAGTPPPEDVLFQIRSSAIMADVLKIVTVMGVPSLLVGGPKTAEELSLLGQQQITPTTTPDVVFRSMSALTVPGVFDYDPGTKRFSLTEVSRVLLEPKAPKSQKPWHARFPDACEIVFGNESQHIVSCKGRVLAMHQGLRNETDDACLSFLRSLLLAGVARVIAVEYVMKQNGDNHPMARISDAGLMLETNGKMKERSEKEFRELFARAGWDVVNLGSECGRGPWEMLEATPCRA